MEGTSKTVAIGRELSDERIRRGQSLDEVAEALRIRRDYVAALERGDWSGMPGEVYGEGFLRSYARYLDLDPERLVAERREELGQEGYVPPSDRVRRAPAGQPVPSRRRRERLNRKRRRRPSTLSGGARDRADGYTPPSLGWVLAVIVALLLVGVYLLKQAEKPAGRPVGAGPRTVLKSKRTRPSKPKVKAARPPAGQKKRAKPTKPKPARAATLTATTSGVNKLGGFFADYDVSRPGPVTVSMVFKATCWTAYWANGAPVDYPAGRTYTAGERATFTASRYVSVRIGDVFAPAIRVDGTPLTGLSTRAKGRVTTLTVTASGG